MTTTLTKLSPRCWVEVDNETEEIVGNYHKPTIVARILYLRDTIPYYADYDLMLADMTALMTLIAGKWTPERNLRITGLINSMWAERMERLKVLEHIAERDAMRVEMADLIVLRDRLV
jgi:hypothetical protein